MRIAKAPPLIDDRIIASSAQALRLWLGEAIGKLIAALDPNWPLTRALKLFYASQLRNVISEARAIAYVKACKRCMRRARVMQTQRPRQCPPGFRLKPAKSSMRRRIMHAGGAGLHEGSLLQRAQRARTFVENIDDAADAMLELLLAGLIRARLVPAAPPPLALFSTAPGPRAFSADTS